MEERTRTALGALYEGASVLYDGPRSTDHLNVDLRDLIADDVTLHDPESTPWGGLRVGYDEVTAAMPGILITMGVRKIELRQLLVDDLHALALVDLEYANDAGDQTAHTTAAEYYRFDEAGKIAEVIIHFFDTAAMLAFKSGADSATPLATI